jgi:hypothetical protein
MGHVTLWLILINLGVIGVPAELMHYTKFGLDWFKRSQLTRG